MKTSIGQRMAATALLCLSLFATAATAGDRPYSQGPIVNVSYIRTTYGMFDDYMKFLAGSWKQEQEALKKAGVIVSYSVLTVEPRSPADPDVVLVTRYANWAALDGLEDKMEAVASAVYGSTAQANAGAIDRGKMRTVLGSTTMQEVILK